MSEKKLTPIKTLIVEGGIVKVHHESAPVEGEFVAYYHYKDALDKFKREGIVCHNPEILLDKSKTHLFNGFKDGIYPAPEGLLYEVRKIHDDCRKQCYPELCDCGRAFVSFSPPKVKQEPEIIKPHQLKYNQRFKNLSTGDQFDTLTVNGKVCENTELVEWVSIFTTKGAITVPRDQDLEIIAKVAAPSAGESSEKPDFEAMADKMYPPQPGKHWIRQLTEAKKKAFVTGASRIWQEYHEPILEENDWLREEKGKMIDKIQSLELQLNEAREENKELKEQLALWKKSF